MQASKLLFPILFLVDIYLCGIFQILHLSVKIYFSVYNYIFFVYGD